MLDDLLRAIALPSGRAVGAAEVVPIGPLLIVGALLLVAVVIALLFGSGRFPRGPGARRSKGGSDESPATPGRLRGDS